MQVLAAICRTEREHGELVGTWLTREIHEAFWENEMTDNRSAVRQKLMEMEDLKMIGIEQ